ncbi:polyprenyl synthetase family protein [Cryobacterium tepidiphilum]|nr:polyprenyl synthetase family protein [Cryobacterium tepidiphilum]
MTLTMTTLNDTVGVADVIRHLSLYFEEKEAKATAYGRQFTELWHAARHASEGGKKFRPALVLTAYRAWGGNDEAAAVAVATAFELLHTAFLLHDDVIDGDTVRRGRPNLVGTFMEQARDRGVGGTEAAVWGNASAILAGDLLIHSAQAMVARLTVGARERSALLDLLEECLFVTAAGEHADVAFSTSVESPVFSEVMAMTQWKTAHYSFQAPLQAGAILAGAGQEAVAALGEFGRSIGIAFQLRDDLLGIFGTGQTGKSTLSDLQGGKLTPLMFYARQLSGSDELRETVGRADVTDADRDRVRQLLEAKGARRFVEKLIDDHRHAALAAIGTPAVPEAFQRHLHDIAHQSCERAA